MSHSNPDSYKTKSPRSGSLLYALISSSLAVVIIVLNIFTFVGCGRNEPHNVVIDEFRNATRDDKDQQDFFSAGISDTLASQLSKIKGLRIVNGSEYKQSLHISGDVFATKTTITIRYFIARSESAKPFAQGQVEGLRSDLMLLQDALARKVTSRLRLHIAKGEARYDEQGYISRKVTLAAAGDRAENLFSPLLRFHPKPKPSRGSSLFA